MLIIEKTMLEPHFTYQLLFGFTSIIYFSYSKDFYGFIQPFHLAKVERHKKKVNIKKIVPASLLPNKKTETHPRK